MKKSMDPLRLSQRKVGISMSDMTEEEKRQAKLERAQKLQETAEAMKKTGKAMQKTGSSMTKTGCSMIIGVILLVLIFVLVKGCMG